MLSRPVNSSPLASRAALELESRRGREPSLNGSPVYRGNCQGGDGEVIKRFENRVEPPRPTEPRPTAHRPTEPRRAPPSYRPPSRYHNKLIAFQFSEVEPLSALRRGKKAVDENLQRYDATYFETTTRRYALSGR